MPDVPGFSWTWQEEPEEGAIVSTPGGRKFKRDGYLWFEIGGVNGEVDDGHEWIYLLAEFGTLNLWRPARVGDRVWGVEIKDLPLMTFMVDEDINLPICKTGEDVWQGPGYGKDEIVTFSWTALINRGFKIVWMKE